MSETAMLQQKAMVPASQSNLQGCAGEFHRIIPHREE
jgi:hypothetical protein